MFGESKDKADTTASCLYKQENQRNPRECWSFRAFIESPDVYIVKFRPHILCVPCSSIGCAIIEATPVFLRSFSPAAAVGVLVERSRRRLHHLWAGSKIPPPGDGPCTILKHAHYLGTFGRKRMSIAQIKLRGFIPKNTLKYVKMVVLLALKV